ncbi:hypothetical protein ABT369_09305 [Dactylosporangium sp. NPDC000244]|uniref:hypothetical protein n=1 Tax=Dactylosporangium sp. NPDC000244 TaxID=3154365 RepID=UPI00332B11F3
MPSTAAARQELLRRELAALGPPGWRRLDAVFALTTTAETVRLEFTDAQGTTVRREPTDVILTLARSERGASAGPGPGPWWRMLITLESVGSAGSAEVVYDHGEHPFPADQLAPPEAYRADLRAYPRERLPLWLAAHIAHDGRQVRSPGQAVAQARVDRRAGVAAVPAGGELPALPEMWARWAVMAAGFVAAGSPLGPRVQPAVGRFEGSRRGGATLYRLPGDRAVLSGGVWDAPALRAAYLGGAPLPALFAGAPEWVAEPLLNQRVHSGLLSFCFWWEGGSWYRGESPPAGELFTAVPGVWTSTTVSEVIADLVDGPGDVPALVTAAEIGVATRSTLVAAFGDSGAFDLDGALHQLTMAGVTATVPEPMPAEDAMAQVRRYVRDRGLDTRNYPLQELRADRIDAGWMLYVPTRPGELAIGRAIFYVADDGVLEQSSSSIAPSVFAADFARRFHERH